jgi:PAS domain S-box-containing protein
MKEDHESPKSHDSRLAESEERYRALVENVRDIIYTVDPDGNLSYANRRWTETLGHDAGTVRGSRFVSLLHPEDREAWEEVFRLTMDGAAAASEVFYRIADRGGDWRWHRIDASAVRGSDRESSFFLCVAEDVTEKRLIEQHLLQVQKLESVGALAGGIAHDIGNLLTPILGYSQMVKDHADNHDLVLEFAEVLDINLAKLDKLTKQLLLFGRKSGNRFHPMDLNAAVAEALKLLAPSIVDGVTLNVDRPSEPLILRGDPNRIQQALLNLCLNAVDAMPNGGTLSVAIGRFAPDDSFLLTHPGSRPASYLRLTVCDTGTGIDPEVRPKIFEPFFTTKERGKGTGLGLPMVLKIVEDHEGFLDVASEIGKGTVFHAFLPEIEEAAGSQSDAATPAATTATPDSAA